MIVFVRTWSPLQKAAAVAFVLVVIWVLFSPDKAPPPKVPPEPEVKEVKKKHKEEPKDSLDIKLEEIRENERKLRDQYPGLFPPMPAGFEGNPGPAGLGG